MGKAGQYNFTGISMQADITLLYLLQNADRPDFQRVIIEGDKWEDFTLVFDDHNEDFEVKWQNRPLSYQIIRKIINKELKKHFGEKDIFNIVAKRISPRFSEDYEYIKQSLYWWYLENKKNLIGNKVISKLFRKKWTEAEIAFLFRTKIKEFENEQAVYNRIIEYFSFDVPFYLDPQNQENLISRFIRKVLTEGAKGGYISRQNFIATIEEFKHHLSDQSESFSPKLSIKRKVINIDGFLKSEKKFGELNHSKYLVPLSANSRLIFYITDQLEKNTFEFPSFEFFISKILLRRNYVNLAMRLLTEKWKNGLLDDSCLLRFIISKYENLFYDFNYYDIWNSLAKIVVRKATAQNIESILDFLSCKVLEKSFYSKGSTERKHKLDSYEKQKIAELLEIIYEKISDKKRLVTFIFIHFDFTSDYFKLVIETHPKVFSIVKKYIIANFPLNLDFVIKAIVDQYDRIYKGKYRGYELYGSGISQAGTEYSITDIGIVRHLFMPIFQEMYTENPTQSWKLFKQNILDKDEKKVSKKNPIFLRRALVNIIVDRMTDKKLHPSQQNEAFQYLKDILMLGFVPKLYDFDFLIY
jgi:hypothetical protein